MADIQPEAEKSLAGCTYHGMAETNDNAKESRIVSVTKTGPQMDREKTPRDMVCILMRRQRAIWGSCHKDQLQSGKVFASDAAWQKIRRTEDHWNLRHKCAASKGHHGMLARPNYKA